MSHLQLYTYFRPCDHSRYIPHPRPLPQRGFSEYLRIRDSSRLSSYLPDCFSPRTCSPPAYSILLVYKQLASKLYAFKTHICRFFTPQGIEDALINTILPRKRHVKVIIENMQLECARYFDIIRAFALLVFVCVCMLRFLLPYPLMEPIIAPLAKCFCKNGYTHRIGKVATTITAILIDCAGGGAILSRSELTSIPLASTTICLSRT